MEEVDRIKRVITLLLDGEVVNPVPTLPKYVEYTSSIELRRMFNVEFGDYSVIKRIFSMITDNPEIFALYGITSDGEFGIDSILYNGKPVIIQ